MAVRKILTVPDPRLKQISKPVEGGVSDDVRALMDDMLETMYAAPGIGLAAIQIGEPLRVIVMDLGDGAGEAGAEDRGEIPNPRYFVNPVIEETIEDMASYEEGCLSIPDIFDEIVRPAKCRISYLDYHGNPVEEWASGLYAVCIQHEMDHLNGVVFIDHLSRLKRERAVAKVKKAAKLAKTG